MVGQLSDSFTESHDSPLASSSNHTCAGKPLVGIATKENAYRVP